MKFFKECFILLIAYLVAPASSIYGGTDAQENTRPYVCSLMWGILSQQNYLCTAVVINTDTLLTAAQCKPYSVGQYHVRCGANNLDSETAQQRLLGDFIVNPRYAGGATSNDIAILKLNEPLVFGNSVSAATLPVDYITEREGDLSAWGVTSGGLLGTGILPSAPNQLQTVKANIQDFETCKRLLAEYNADDNMDETMTCTTGAGNSGICSGDAGAPFVQNNIVMGIASWRVGGCGQNNSPSVYTSVRSHLDFINVNT